ncbi:hypothetical protein BU26DRAFT_380685, partial [Trematosphaeria pertusa]
RLYHEASAHFQTIDIHGRLDEGEVPVDIDPEDALVSIPPEVGESLGVACALQQALVASSDIQPLVYRHATRSFTPLSTPLPRLTIAESLPPQTNGTTSPATLYLFGFSHSFTLNGT